MIWLLLWMGCALWRDEAPPEPLRCKEGPSDMGCFVSVPGATLLLGAQAVDPAAPGYDPAAEPSEGPPHAVQVGPFWIQRNEVSTGAWRLCLEAGVCRIDDVLAEGVLSNLGWPGREEHPINGITWDGARRYCGFAHARLPTEAEWELAARGTEGRRWPWGGEPACGVGVMDRGTRWGQDMADGACDNEGTSVPGDLRGTGPYGAMAQAGNVAEWVEEAYAPYDGGAAAGDLRVVRGGGWTEADPVGLRATVRGVLPADAKLPDVGVRCVWAP